MADAATIPHLAIDSADRFGARPAVVTPGGGVVSYADIGERMMAAAGAFVAAGVRRGDRVAIWAPNQVEWIVAALGAQAAGASLVPLNTRFKGAEAAYIVRRSGARMLLTVPSFLGSDYPAMIAAEDAGALERIVIFGDPGGRGWDAFLAEGAASDPARVRAALDALGPDDVSDILFTSGTTGKPKGVVTSHGQNLAVYRIYSEALGWTGDDRLLAINPFFHSFGYKAGWLCSLMRGSTLFPMLAFDPADALDAIERHRITLVPGPPTIFQSLLECPLETRDLRSLRLAVTGATVVPATLVTRMRDVLGFDRVVTAYGLTETCGVVSMCSPDDDVETIASTSGRPVPGLSVEVVEADGAKVATGVAGEIRVRGPNVMRGYFEDPGATAEVLDAQGWLRTGDIGVMRPDGCLTITDRARDVYICGGFNVYPAEVEQMLASHPAVSEAAVIGVPDRRLGEVGHAFVALRPHEPVTAAELIDWSRGIMANFKVPRAISVVDRLPRNASGKVEKFKLRAEP